MISKRVSKEYYVLRDMENDDRFGKRYIFSNEKPTAVTLHSSDKDHLKIVATVQVSGESKDMALFERLWPSNKLTKWKGQHRKG